VSLEAEEITTQIHTEERLLLFPHRENMAIYKSRRGTSEETNSAHIQPVIFVIAS
jgi:hypothetical protein